MKGYTLIEILVALTIIGLLFGVGYVGFRDFSRRQALSGAAKQMQGDLSLAQGYALAGQIPEGCNGHELIGYNFNIFLSGYAIEAVCVGVALPVQVKSVSYNSDISLTVSSVNPILFKVLGSGTNIQKGLNDIIVLTQAGTGNMVTITVGSGGERR